MDSRNFLIAALILILIISIQTCRNKSTQYLALEGAVNDSIMQYRNRNGELVDQIISVETNKISDFLKIKMQDSTIKELQELVNMNKKSLKPGSNATIVKTIIKIDTLVDTRTEFDTVYNNDTVKLYPVYDFNLNDEWINVHGQTRISGAILDISIKSDYNVVHKKYKGNWVTEITNKNPYADTKEIKSYNVPIKNKKASLGLQVGVGVNSDLKITPYAGVGINYSIIKF